MLQGKLMPTYDCLAQNVLLSKHVLLLNIFEAILLNGKPCPKV